MYLIRTPQGDVVEGNLSDGEQLTNAEIGALLSGEAANVELFNARAIEFARLIAEKEEKKLLFDNGDVESIQQEIDNLTAELELIPSQKASAKDRVTLYNKYV